MATIPVSFEMAAFPPSESYTPQEFADALAERLSMVSAQDFALFVTGSIAPTSNVGPWLKDGTTWYVWDTVTGAYIPMAIEPSSLGYIISQAFPDADVYKVWYRLNGSNVPNGLFLSIGGVWTDALSSYQTTAAMANYYTIAGTNSAISSAISGATPNAYPAQGVVTGVSIGVTGLPIKIPYNTASINPAPAPFNTTLNRYVAPATGVYDVSVATQFDNNTGNAATMEIDIGLYKNGTNLGNGMGDTDSTPSPNGNRWSPSFGGLVQLNSGDYIEVIVIAGDGVNTGALTLTVANMSVCRVSG